MDLGARGSELGGNGKNEGKGNCGPRALKANNKKYIINFKK